MKQLLIFFLLLLFAFGLDYQKADLASIEGQTITVTVEGEVQNPGEITIHPYATIAELLEQVTVTEEADLSVFNRDTVLNDHDILRIPAKKQESENQRISINTATANDLTALPGIGEAMAERIIAYRNEHGLFQTIDELRNVKGIGERKYEALEDLITL